MASNHEVCFMAEVTRRRTGEFLRELFTLLMAAPDGAVTQR